MLRSDLQADGNSLPTQIHLPAINETWRVIFKEGLKKENRSKADYATCCLTLYGEANVQQLQHWLKGMAKKHLIPILQSMSKAHQLPYRCHSIRLQSTRWGSCTQQKDISLNAKLLLLPLDVAHYVIIHELVHTRYLNHSAAFWEAVTALVPNQRALRAQLKNLEQSLPNWVY